MMMMMMMMMMDDSAHFSFQKIATMSTPSCHNTPHHPSASESPTNISNVGWNSPKKWMGFWRKKTRSHVRSPCRAQGASKSMPIAEAKKSPQSLLSWVGTGFCPIRFTVGKSSKFFMMLKFGLQNVVYDGFWRHYYHPTETHVEMVVDWEKGENHVW